MNNELSQHKILLNEAKVNSEAMRKEKVNITQ
jgi:hypothetical protein